MALQLPSSFAEDIKGKDTNLIPVIIFGDVPHFGDISVGVELPWDELNLTAISTNSISYDFVEIKPLLLNVPSLKESIDIEKRNYKISSINIDISNLPYKGQRFSDIIADSSLINKECRIFWVSQSINYSHLDLFRTVDVAAGHVYWGDSAFQVYYGVIRKYEHGDEKARIVVEDNSQAALHRDLPLPNDWLTGQGVPDKYKNKPIPIVYGSVDNSPCVSDDGYASFMAGRTATYYDHGTNIPLNTQSALSFGDENGLVNVVKSGQLEYSSNKILLTKEIGGTSNEIAESTAEDLKQYSLRCTDSNPNMQISASNTIWHPNATTADFCDPERLAAVLGTDVSNSIGISSMIFPIHTLDFSTDTPIEVLYVTISLNFMPTRKHENLKIKAFALNGYDLTALLGNQYGSHSDAGAYNAYPHGWHYLSNYDNIGTYPEIPEAFDGDNISGVSGNYDKFNNIVQPSSIDSHFGRDAINEIFNWTNAVGGTGNNPAADIHIDVNATSAGGTVVHKGGLVLFYSGGEEAGIFNIDFRGIFQINEESADHISAQFHLHENMHSLKLISIYDVFDVLKEDFYANVMGRGMQVGNISPTAPQVIEDIIKNELNPVINVDMPPVSSSYGWQVYDFTIHKKINSKKLIETIASTSPYLPRFDNMGNFKFSLIELSYQYHTPVTENHLIEESDVIDFSFSRTPIEQVYTKVSFRYKWDYVLEEFDGTTDPINIVNGSGANDWFGDSDGKTFDYYGLKNDHTESTLIIDDDRGKYIRDSVTANRIAGFLLSWHCNQHIIMKVKLPLKYMNLEIGDVVQFKNLLGNVKPYGINYTDPDVILNSQKLFNKFMITSTNKTLDYVQIECVQMHLIRTTACESGDFDCLGICDGTAVVDECGICDGPGAVYGPDEFGNYDNCPDCPNDGVSICGFCPDEPEYMWANINECEVCCDPMNTGSSGENPVLPSCASNKIFICEPEAIAAGTCGESYEENGQTVFNWAEIDNPFAGGANYYCGYGMGGNPEMQVDAVWIPGIRLPGVSSPTLVASTPVCNEGACVDIDISGEKGVCRNLIHDNEEDCGDELFGTDPEGGSDVAWHDWDAKCYAQKGVAEQENPLFGGSIVDQGYGGQWGIMDNAQGVCNAYCSLNSDDTNNQNFHFFEWAGAFDAEGVPQDLIHGSLLPRIVDIDLDIVFPTHSDFGSGRIEKLFGGAGNTLPTYGFHPDYPFDYPSPLYFATEDGKQSIFALENVGTVITGSTGIQIKIKDIHYERFHVQSAKIQLIKQTWNQPDDDSPVNPGVEGWRDVQTGISSFWDTSIEDKIDNPVIGDTHENSPVFDISPENISYDTYTQVSTLKALPDTALLWIDKNKEADIQLVVFIELDDLENRVPALHYVVQVPITMTMQYCRLGDMKSDGGYTIQDLVMLAIFVANDFGYWTDPNDIFEFFYEQGVLFTMDEISSMICSGDINQDSSIDILDVVTLLNCLLTGSCGCDLAGECDE